MKHTPRYLALVIGIAAALSGAAAASLGPEDDHSYRAGIGLLNKGLSDVAVKEFRDYLDEHPDGAEATNARYSLAVCLTRLNRHADAAKELALVTAVKGFEFAPDALLLQAQCTAAAGDDAGTVRVLDRIDEKYPKFAQLDRAAAMHGEALYRVGKYKLARATLSGVATRWPASPALERAELFAAMAEAADGEPAAAAARAARLRTRFPRGDYAANAALVEARCRQQLKDLAAAARLFAAAAETSGPARAEALLGLAVTSRAQGDLPRAEQALSDAAKEKPSDTVRESLEMEKGKLLLQKGDAPGASAAFIEARKHGTDAFKAEAAYWFAKCQIKQGKYNEAAANLEHSAEAYPESDLLPDMLFERATALSKGDDDEGALEAWGEWRERFAGSDLAKEAALAEAWCAHRLGKIDQSEALCKGLPVAGEAPPESVALLTAENAFAAQKFDRALEAYGSLLDHYPKSRYAARAGLRRVLCLAKLDRVEEASTAFQPLEAATDQDAELRRAVITALADQYFGKSDWPRAEHWFALLTREKGPAEDRLDALLRQGICIERRGRFADALPPLDEAAKDTSAPARALQAQFERGQCLLSLGKLDEARAAFEQVAAAKDAGELPVHAARSLASIASRQGRHEDAAALLAELPAGEGSAADSTALDLGSAYLAAGKYERAEETLDTFIDQSPRSPRTTQARTLRAIALSRLGKHQEALKDLQSSSGDASLDADLRASATYELGVALRETGDEAGAGVAFRSILQGSTPRLSAYAALDLAQIESKASRFEQSLPLLEQCLATADTLGKPDGDVLRERATYLRGACLLQLKRPKEAAESLKAFAATYPRSALLSPVRLVRGEALLASGQAKEAAEELSLLNAKGQPPEARQTALLRLGEAWANCQNWTASDQAFTSFLEQFKDSPLWFQARFGQGWARENQGRQDPAIEAYRDVVARHSGATAARAQFQIGECLYAQGKHEQAVAELLKTDVLFAYPEWSAAALYEAGRCLGEMKRPGDSRAQFDDLIKRFPESRWAKLALKKIEASAPAPIPGHEASVPPGR